MASFPSRSGEEVRLLRFLLDGAVVGGVIYGVHLTLFFECLPLLMRQSKEKVKWRLVAFISINFVLGSIQFGAQTKGNEVMFIDRGGEPSGPFRIYFNEPASVFTMLTFAMYFALNWTTDAFLIYRLFLFWSRDWKVIGFPCLALVGSIVLGTLLLVHAAQPHGDPRNSLALRLGGSFVASSLTINVYVTTLIVGRIIVLRREIDRLLSAPKSSWRPKLFSYVRFGKSKYEERPNIEPNNHSPALRCSLGKRNRDATSSATSMLLESAALVTITTAISLILYLCKSDFVAVVWSVVGQIVAIAALLIVVRVARGTAWDPNDVAEVSSIRFS